MTMLYWCIIGYLIILLQTVIHEFAHLTVAKFFHIPVKSISIGWKKCAIKFKNIYFSPILLGGHVEVFEKELKTKSPLKIIAFFEAGAIANLFFSFLPMFFLRNVYTFVWLSLGVSFALSANLPIESSDVYNAFVTLKKRNQNNHEYVK